MTQKFSNLAPEEGEMEQAWSGDGPSNPATLRPQTHTAPPQESRALESG